MNQLQKIFMGLLILAVVFCMVYSKIQMDYAIKEREKAMIYEKKAEATAMEAQKQAAEANAAIIRAQLLAEELEACKAKK